MSIFFLFVVLCLRCLPLIVHSCKVHPCNFLRHCPLLQCQLLQFQCPRLPPPVGEIKNLQNPCFVHISTRYQLRNVQITSLVDDVHQLLSQITRVSSRGHLPCFRRRCIQDTEDSDIGRSALVTRSRRQVVVQSRGIEPI